ncbi:ABC transporter permease [Enterococcus sp. BWB1-3]|uniref:ABC transporter permease n=1 Tax=Enterococcus sp. BWB1-3 TaxID=2787713 RepID=UPI0019245D25|nr:ABC transporter permease [Enterococcus sp. BWB1-3]MBL1228810.1 ABC transporter permease [Enterococcus sp. BWB1-3]
MNFLSHFKKNKLDTLCTMVVVFLAITIGTIFIESNRDLKQSLDKVKAEGAVSDFSYYPSVTEQDMLEAGGVTKSIEAKNQELAKKYDFTWEEHRYSIVRENNLIYRVISADRKMDRFLLEEGELPVKDSELVVDKNFAKTNQLEVGQTYTLNDEEYKISGIVTVSNILSPIVDDAGELYDEKSQGIIVLFKQEYDQKYSNSSSSTFVGKFFGKKSNFSEMQKDTQFYQLESNEENPAVYGTITSIMNMNMIIAVFAVSLLLLIAFILIMVSTRKQIDHDIVNIGVLKAMGYSSLEIVRKYFVTFFIVFIPAGVGYFVGYLLSPIYYEMMFHSLLLPSHEDGIKPLLLIMLVLLPSICAGLFSVATCLLKIKKPALQLMKGQVKTKVSKRIIKANIRIKEHNFLAGLKRIIVRSSISTLFFVGFGGFALGVQSQFAYMTYFMTENMVENATEGIAYEREVHYTEELKPDANLADTVYYYYLSASLSKGNQNLTNITLNILQQESASLLTLHKSTGGQKKINLADENGLVINQWMSQRYDLNIGDSVSVTLSGKKHELKISAVDQRNYGKSVYLSQDTALKTGLLDKETYNSVLTNLAPEKIQRNPVSTIETSSLEDKMRSENETYQLLAVFLFMSGLIMGLAILILAFLNVLKSYKKYIATMKMMGYSAEECNQAVYSGFRKVAFIGYVISIPYSILLSMMMFGFLSKTTDMLYQMDVSPLSVVVCLVLTAISIELSIMIAKRQLKEVSYKEILE